MPYAAAKELLDIFNKDLRIWTHDTPNMYNVPLGLLEPHHHYAKLWNQVAKNAPAAGHTFRPSSEAPGMQAILAQLDSESQYQVESTSDGTPGYHTIDDAGSDGDDTPHVQIPFNRIKNAMVANTFEQYTARGTEPETVDVVFMDFIQQYIIGGLEKLGHNYTGGDVEAYMPENVHLRRMMLRYAAREWPCK